MARKRYSDVDALKLLLEIEIHLHSGMDVVSASQKAGVSDKTYYYWRKKFGGMPLDLSQFSSASCSHLTL